MFSKFVDSMTKVGRITIIICEVNNTPKESYLSAKETEKTGCGLRRIKRHRYFFAIGCYHIQSGE